MANPVLAPAAGAQAEAVPQPAAAVIAVHNSSLYVGDLDREVTEQQLFELFSQCGPVASIRVCRDAVTRRSLGYAYVNYNSAVDPEAAERALDNMNYQPLNGRPMRIMWSHRDPSARRSGLGNIFIKNLDKEIDHKALHDTFTAFGSILSCKVATDSSDQSKGYGFVHFEKEAAAKLAIDKVNGMLLAGQKVYVGPFLKKSDRPMDKESRFTNVYVKNLPDSVDDQKLNQMFSEHGSVTSAIVMKNDDDTSRGFGFVNFEDADSAQAAVSALNGKEMEDKELYVGRAQKKSEREAALKQRFDEARRDRGQKYEGMNLYIKNLVDEVDDAELRAEFLSFGTITSAKVMRNPQGKSKGFGFVCYSSFEEATRAVTEMSGRMLHDKPLYVAMAQRSEQRKAQLQQRYQQPAGFMGAHMGPMGPMGPPMPGMNGPMPMYPGAMPPYMQGPGPRGMGPRGYPRGPPGPMMYPPMMPQRMGRGGRGMPRMGPYDMPYPPPPGAMMMGGRGPPDGFRPRYAGGRGGRGGQQWGGPDRSRGPQGRGPQGRGRGGPGPQQAVPAPPPPPPVAAAPAAAAAAPMAASGVVPGQQGSQLTTAMLAAAPPEQQKQMLGERLFPLVQQLQPVLAGKITGMLLEMDNSELLLLLESSDALTLKTDEAISVLKQHNALPEDVNLPADGDIE
ncbi:hypothetical protein ABBQ38_000851 [Trebouxia sp. C0009 RCD-2024]